MKSYTLRKALRERKAKDVRFYLWNDHSIAGIDGPVLSGKWEEFGRYNFSLHMEISTGKVFRLA
jgi:hypothetical protein